MYFPKFHRTGMSNDNKHVVDVGWVLQASQASFLWEAPRPFRRRETPPEHAKSVAFCPAVVDHETRLIEVLCPFDLHLRVRIKDNGEATLIDVAGDQSDILPSSLMQLAMLPSRKEWLHPRRPILQIRTPYTFISDEVVHMVQLPPFLDYRDPPWPGLFIGGRVPIQIWPRPLNWAFEWYDIEKDLILARGQPWFYCRFETPDASRHVRLVEATLTPELRTYLAGMDGVVKYVSKTFSLFPIAKERRPARLLVRVKR